MALIELYRITGRQDVISTLPATFCRATNASSCRQRQTIYMFCGTPFTSRTRMEGHAVRAMYACCGATDYYLETGDQSYLEDPEHALERPDDHQMYVTGGVGSRSDGEAFGDAYELPNFRAYGESCAAIGNMMWNWRMLAVTGDAKFTDVMERALYNGINSGMSLDGTTVLLSQPAGLRSLQARTRSAIPGTTRPAVLRTLNAPLLRSPATSTARARTASTCISTTIQQLNWHLENGSRP